VAAALVAATHSPARPNASPQWVTVAKQRLSQLEAKPSASMTGYSRAKFGPAWEDVDLNGCDTRNDMLARDLKQIILNAGSECVVAITGKPRKPELDGESGRSLRPTGRGREGDRGPIASRIAPRSRPWSPLLVRQ
jgi:hypothetical protein